MFSVVPIFIGQFKPLTKGENSLGLIDSSCARGEGGGGDRRETRYSIGFSGPLDENQFVRQFFPFLVPRTSTDPTLHLPAVGQIRTRTQRSDRCVRGTRARPPESRLTMASYLLNIRTGDTPRPLFVVSVASYFIARKV